MAIRTRNGIIGGKESTDAASDAGIVEGLIKQMRYFKNRVYADKLPCFASMLDAAIWIRENGNNPLTNETFKGLLSDLVARTVSEEEYLTVRLYTSPRVKYMRNSPIDGFITEEEKEYLEKIIKDQDTDMHMHLHVQMIDTLLGTYVEGL